MTNFSVSNLPRPSRNRLTSPLAFFAGVALLVCLLAGLERLQLFDGKLDATGLWLVLPALAGICLLGGAWWLGWLGRAEDPRVTELK